MKKSLAVILALAVLSAAAFLSFDMLVAQRGPGGHGAPGAAGMRGPGGGPGGFAAHFLGRLADKLQLTDQQREQARAILEEERTANEPLREELRANHEALREASQFGAFYQNEAQITALAQRQGELHAQMIVSRERVKARLYDILTPEQQQKLKDLVDMFGGMGFGFGPHHGR